MRQRQRILLDAYPFFWLEFISLDCKVAGAAVRENCRRGFSPELSVPNKARG